MMSDKIIDNINARVEIKNGQVKIFLYSDLGLEDGTVLHLAELKSDRKSVKTGTGKIVVRSNGTEVGNG